jgi:hypothetical protein
MKHYKVTVEVKLPVVYTALVEFPDDATQEQIEEYIANIPFKIPINKLSLLEDKTKYDSLEVSVDSCPVEDEKEINELKAWVDVWTS